MLRKVTQGLAAEVIREDAETSLRNLGLDRLDLYYVHIDDRSAPAAETVDALASLAESGRPACSVRATRPPGGSNAPAAWRARPAGQPTAAFSSSTPTCSPSPNPASST